MKGLLYKVPPVTVVSAEDVSFLLDKATSPSNRQEEWEHMMAFCEQVNKDPDG